MISKISQTLSIAVNDTTLAYRDSGQGEPMVLVHANISDMRSWDAVENDLAKSFRVINYSRRHAWPNTPIAAGADDPWDQHAKDLEGLIEKLGLGPVHAVGNSTGAFIALLVARRRPDLLQTLILEEPPVLSLFLPHTPPGLLDVAKFLFAQPAAFLPIIKFGATVIEPTTKAFKQGRDEQALQTFARGVLGAAFYDKLTPERHQQMRDNVNPHGALFLGSGLPVFRDSDASAVKTPTLVLRGAQTPDFQQAINRRLAQLIPGAQEGVVPGASHLIHEDNPAATTQLVLQYVWQRREQVADAA